MVAIMVMVVFLNIFIRFGMSKYKNTEEKSCCCQCCHGCSWEMTDDVVEMTWYLYRQGQDDLWGR